MDPFQWALKGQPVDTQPSHRTTISRRTTHGSDEIQLLPSISLTSPRRGLPFYTSSSPNYTYSLSTMTLKKLPEPASRVQNIVKYQLPGRPCSVCQRIECNLDSHRHYTRIAQTRQNSHQPLRKSPTSGPHTPARPPEGFVSYPLLMDSERQRSLALWSQNWSPVRRGPERHLFPVRWIDLILPAAIRHAPLFQALLAVSLSLWALANDAKDGVAPRHLQLAIQMLTHSCSEQSVARTDEAILASILITLILLAQGDSVEVGKRYAGIVQEVESRGGPHYLGMSGIVAELLLHADHTQAVLFEREPAFKLPLPALEVGIVPRLGTAFRGHSLHLDLLLAADSLCRTTDIFELPRTDGRTLFGVLNSFGYLSSVAEYQLARCNVMFQGTASWNECTCLALLLFNNVVLRNHGNIDMPTRRLTRRFWSAIEATGARTGFADIPPCLLLWILITGLTPCIYIECQYRINAVEKMRAARISAAIHGWDQFRIQVLDPHLWMRAVQEDIFRDVWHEVEGVRVVIKSS